MDETEQVGGNENPRLSAEELAGMGDFWEVYDAHYDEVSAALREELADDPEIGPVLQAAPAELQAEEDRQSREIMGAAICDGAWHAYLAHLRTVGGTYGEAGLGFAGWFAAVGALRTHMGPRLRTAYGDSQERLLAADRGMNAFVDLAMAAIGEEYLAAREQRIGEQQEAIRELSTPVLELRPGLLILR